MAEYIARLGFSGNPPQITQISQFREDHKKESTTEQEPARIRILGQSVLPREPRQSRDSYVDPRAQFPSRRLIFFLSSCLICEICVICGLCLEVALHA